VPHYHDSWDEVAYGLKGAITFRVADQDIVLRPGQSVFIKRGVVHGFRNDTQEGTGQLRPYVRPVMRHLPLAIMGVRLRVRHQSFRRAQGTVISPVLPKLYVLDYRLSHHAVLRLLPVRRAFARRPPSTGLSCHNLRCSYDVSLCVVDLVARHQRPCDARYLVRQCDCHQPERAALEQTIGPNPCGTLPLPCPESH
jgi:Cupin domain